MDSAFIISNLNKQRMIENILKYFSRDVQPDRIDQQIFVQFTKRDPDSNQILSKVVKNQYKLIPEYEDWKRLKFKSLDINKITAKLKGSNFIDPEFPHTNASISQQDSQIVFEWRRIPEIVKFALYSSAETFQNFERISMSNKKLKEALLFMYRTHPTKFKQILAQDCNDQGYYQFKLYHKGVIQNVIIDDYVPVINKVHPLMVGPIADREVFPMLIQKALAKVCGAYDKIPQNLDELLEILFCGPLRKTKIDQLTDTEIVARTVQNTLLNNGVAAFLSKNQPKIRSFGISENEIYHIIHKVSVNIKNQQDIQLYQLISEKKLASWNGKFSHNDSEWDKVNHLQRAELFKRLNKNKSFFVCAHDISRIFDHLIAFDGTDIINKQWLEMQSETLYPSFSNFQLDLSDQVYIRVTAKDPVRSSLIIAKDNGNNNYVCVDGKFHEGTYSLQLNVSLKPGKYVICVHHDWILNSQGPYSIFMSSYTHSILKPSKQSQYPNFLENMFKNLSERSKKLSPIPPFLTIKKCYTIGFLAKQTGFAFIWFSLKDTTQKQLFIDIDQKILAHQSWQILQPNKDRKSIQLGKDSKDELMIILKTHKYVSQQNTYFPSTAFKIKI